MLNKKPVMTRLFLLMGGVASFLLPCINTEIDLIYVLSPWVYLTCFLLYTRTIRKKWEWVVFEVIFLTILELRYQDFLGGTKILLTLVSVLLLMVLTAGLSFPFWMDRIYQKHGPRWLSMLVFPCMRVLMEQFVVGQQFNLSLTQFGNKWLLQSTAFLGDIFLSFVVALVPSALAHMIINRKDKRTLRAGAAALIFCTLIFAAGAIRLSAIPKPDNSIFMAYASGPQKTYYEDPSEVDPEYEENLEYLRSSVRDAAKNGAKLIAYAEEAFMIYGQEMNDLIVEAEKLAVENDIYILLAFDYSYMDESNEVYANIVTLVDNQGELRADYNKTYLIPVIEEDIYEAGDGIIPAEEITIDGQERVVSYTVCYDATFADYISSVDRRTNLFINPSWDWEEIVDLNYRMQGISAVEAGVVLFKPTVDGWSIVTDPCGRLLYKENTLGQSYDKIYYADVPAVTYTTVYQQIREHLLRVYVAIELAMLGLVLFVMVRQIVRAVRLKKQKKAELAQMDPPAADQGGEI